MICRYHAEVKGSDIVAPTLSGMMLESENNAHLLSLQGITFIRLNELVRPQGVKVWKFKKKI